MDYSRDITVTLQVRVKVSRKEWDNAYGGRVPLTPENAVGYFDEMIRADQDGVVESASSAAVRVDGYDVVPIGRRHDLEVMATVRTVEQRRAVIDIIRGDAFGYAISNPFTPEVGESTGPFNFLWVCKTGLVVATRIGKHGNVLRQVTHAVDPDKFRQSR